MVLLTHSKQSPRSDLTQIPGLSGPSPFLGQTQKVVKKGTFNLGHFDPFLRHFEKRFWVILTLKRVWRHGAHNLGQYCDPGVLGVYLSPDNLKAYTIYRSNNVFEVC